MNRTMRSGSGNGSGLSSTVLTTEKMAVLAPMPSVSAATRRGREAGRLPEHPQRVPEIAKEVGHVSLYQISAR